MSDRDREVNLMRIGRQIMDVAFEVLALERRVHLTVGLAAFVLSDLSRRHTDNTKDPKHFLPDSQASFVAQIPQP